MRLTSWNVGGAGVGWPDVLALAADVALLQEAPAPHHHEIAGRVLPHPDDGEWMTAALETRPWRTALVELSDAINLEPVAIAPLGAMCGTLIYSRAGS